MRRHGRRRRCWRHCGKKLIFLFIVCLPLLYLPILSSFVFILLLIFFIPLFSNSLFLVLLFFVPLSSSFSFLHLPCSFVFCKKWRNFFLKGEKCSTAWAVEPFSPQIVFITATIDVNKKTSINSPFRKIADSEASKERSRAESTMFDIICIHDDIHG